MSDLPRVVPFGDAALLVVLGERIDDALNTRVHALAKAVDRLAASGEGVHRAVPAYASVLVPFDPLRQDGAELARRLADLAGSDALVKAADALPPAPLVEVPTRYGGRDGPDLDAVAELHGLQPDQVAELHASVEYRVHFVGFAPGFAYLGTLPEAIATPRRPTPRARVPRGSVGIADRQTGIYPFEAPGGWRLIGRTEVEVWDATRPQPALLAPGSRVRFVPVRGEGRP